LGGPSLGALKQCIQGRWQPLRFALGLGLPLTFGKSGRLLPGTYSRASEDCGASHRREKLQNPDFIRGWAATVLLAKPGKRMRDHPGLEFTRFHGEWYLLRRCHTLRGARTLAGLAITSPDKVFSYLGRSLSGLAEYTPDQLRWLQCGWRSCKAGNNQPTGPSRLASLKSKWTSNRKARRSLARSVAKATVETSSPLQIGQSPDMRSNRSFALRDTTRDATAHNLMWKPTPLVTLRVTSRRRGKPIHT